VVSLDDLIFISSFNDFKKNFRLGGFQIFG
jgi:hypothetical protein